MVRAMIKLYDVTQRQNIRNTARRLGIKIKLKHIKVDRRDTSTKGMSRVGFLRKAQLEEMVMHFENRFEETGHYSTGLALKKYKNLLNKFK